MKSSTQKNLRKSVQSADKTSFGSENLLDHLSATRSPASEAAGLAENLVRPIVDFVWREVGPAWAPFLSEAAALTLRQNLVRRLADTGRRAALWELQMFAMTPGLGVPFSIQPTPELMHRFFQSGIESETLRLLRNYPALTHLWIGQIQRWTTFISDFLGHWTAFARERKMPRRIPFLKLDLSDPHHGNRTVIRVHNWYYKPRSGENERAWFGLLQWLNDTGWPLPFRILAIHTRPSHCWMKPTIHRSCQTRRQVGNFYRRAGAMLYLLECLQGVDIHAGNLIASGEHPMIIDCETLCHPPLPVPEEYREAEISVLRTGMLPVPMQPGGTDVSALGRREYGPHRVKLGRKHVAASPYRGQIVSGYLQMRRFLADHAQNLETALEPFRQIAWRQIHQPTAHYQAILRGSLAPALLEDGAARLRHLQAALPPSDIAEAEIGALLQADIPHLSGKAAPFRQPDAKAARLAIALIQASLS